VPIALLLAGTSLAACTGNRPPAPANPVTGSAVPAPATTYRWSSCPLPAGPDAVVRAITAGGAGVPWTAVGLEHATGGDRPAVWTAADGCRWRRVPVRTITPDGEHTRFTSVVRSGHLVVALGGGSSAIHGSTRPTLWRADGAAPLGEVALLRELFGPPRGISVSALAAGPDAVVAVGGFIASNLQAAAQVWRTADGTAWQRLDVGPELVSTRAEQLIAAEAAAGPAGALMVGTAWQLSNGLRDGADAAAWYAPGDGRQWRRGDLRGAGLTGVGDQRLLAATWLRSGYVVLAAVPVGAGLGLRSAVSPDGRAWTAGGPLPADQTLRGTSLPAVRLTPGPAGDVLAGTVIAGRPVLWRSPDGRTWQPEAVPTSTAGPSTGSAATGDAATGLALAADANRLTLIVQTAAGPLAYLGRAP
jgi:hypothetical protein